MRKRSWLRFLIAFAGGLVVAAPASVSATAVDSGSVTLTIPIAVYSVTVDPGAGTFATCSLGQALTNALSFPNGQCQAPGSTEGANPGYITITNTGTVGNLYIQSTGVAKVPNNASARDWTICTMKAGGTCNGPVLGAGHLPGQDQFEMLNISAGFGGPDITATPACDIVIDPGNKKCQALANTPYREQLLLNGPTVSTDSSSSRTTSVTWTIAP
ncbi:MAG TPA: hypothetical protein VJT14_16395 [Candidatus Dormibacteraeota bacterium]|nr:hypothetical protein [Candidatus Dormibacteraeota bacterium]